MTKVVTIRVVLDDERVDHFIGVLDSRDIFEFALDSVVETHPLPTFIEDSIVNETYVKGEFTKGLNVGYCSSDHKGVPRTVWHEHIVDDLYARIEYKYDTLPELGEKNVVQFSK